MNQIKAADKCHVFKKRTNARDSKGKDPVAVIVDHGGNTIKTGLSDNLLPKITPNCIVKSKAERKRLFIADQIRECRDCSGLYYLLPCERGYITKWDVQKPVWDHIFMKNICPINDYPVIMTQPIFNFKSIQECIDEIFFEEYEVSSMLRLNPTDLAAFKYMNEQCAREGTLLIVDSGFSFTHIVPYINKKKFMRGVQRLNVGGKLLTNYLKDIISYRQYHVMEETYVINQVKEDTCYAAKNIKEELKLAKFTNSIVRNYVLPDFNNIRRGYIQNPNDVKQKQLEENCQILRLNNERFMVPEIIFHPSNIDIKSMGLAEAIVKSINSCHRDYRSTLANNILVVGGNCKFPGFKDRLFAELRPYLPDHWDVRIVLPEDPITYTWKGGSYLVKQPDYSASLVTKEEYDELGSYIIQRRFNTYMTDHSKYDQEKDDELKKKPLLSGISKDILGKPIPFSAPQIAEHLSSASVDSSSGLSTFSQLGSVNLNMSKMYYEVDEDVEDWRNSRELFPLGIDAYL